MSDRTNNDEMRSHNWTCPCAFIRLWIKVNKTLCIHQSAEWWTLFNFRDILAGRDDNRKSLIEIRFRSRWRRYCQLMDTWTIDDTLHTSIVKSDNFFFFGRAFSKCIPKMQCLCRVRPHFALWVNNPVESHPPAHCVSQTTSTVECRAIDKVWYCKRQCLPRCHCSFIHSKFLTDRYQKAGKCLWAAISFVIGFIQWQFIIYHPFRSMSVYKQQQPIKIEIQLAMSDNWPNVLSGRSAMLEYASD